MLGTHKHTLQAENTSQRASWIVALEKKVEEAKALKDEITGSDTYKENVKKFSMFIVPLSAGHLSFLALELTGFLARPITAIAPPAVAAKAETPSKSTETPAKETPKASSDDDTSKQATTKSRSQSRKRGSVFGTILGKKEQHDEKKEVKKEEKPEEKAEKKLEKDEVKADEPSTEAAPAATAAAAGLYLSMMYLAPCR